MLRTHLTILENSASRFANAAVFRTPEIDSSTKRIKGWKSITYREFYRDVETFAKHWTRMLRDNGIPQRSVVGVWYVFHILVYWILILLWGRLSGFLYTDVLHIYGLSRAGYIPQLFSIRLPNPIVIYELLCRAGARALVYDVSFSNILGDCPVPTHLASDVRGLDLRGVPLPPILSVTQEDIGFIFHTSGSTSGSPKLVLCRYRWLLNVVEKSYLMCRPRNPHRQDVTVFMYASLPLSWSLFGLTIFILI